MPPALDNKTAKQRMIQTALELFHENGVHGTSVDMVLERSHTGKSQFSHYFQTKEGLVLAVLRQFSEWIEDGTLPNCRPIRSWKDLEGWFYFFIEWQETVKFAMSCPVATIGHDLSRDQIFLKREVREIFSLRRNFLIDFFKQEQARGGLRKSPSAETLADFCYTIMQGGLLMGKMEQHSKSFKNAADQALTYLKSMRLLKK
jgi:TetR/AcrR family transcriptional repressor of nem operon